MEKSGTLKCGSDIVKLYQLSLVQKIFWFLVDSIVEAIEVHNFCSVSAAYAKFLNLGLYGQKIIALSPD